MAVNPSNGNQDGPGITRISVTGFKSLATKADVEIRPLTVLAGANSSGKSSIMQPLLLMKQTLESDFNPAGPFLLSGPYLQYTGTKQFLTRTGGRNGSSQPLTLEFGFNPGLTAGMAYSVEPEAGLNIVETWGSNAVTNTKWKIAKDSTPEDLRAMLLELGSISLLMEQVGFTQISVQDSGFYHSILYSAPEPLGRRRGETYFMQENLELNSQIRRLIYVPGVRGDQSRKRLFAEIAGPGFFPGSFEYYLPTLIDSWDVDVHGDRRKIHDLIGALRTLELASGIGSRRLSESEIEVSIPRTRNSADDDPVNIADVGLAVPIVLPVLVALIEADPGQLVYIEQPELHLHPRAQWRLAQLLARAANRGVKLVIETHSSLLLQGILTQVARNQIANDKVILHWFWRDAETGMSTAESAEPDSAGRVGEWPEDFSDVELKASNEYLDAAESKLMAGREAG
ncbi:MAG TPA: AAA family ATPase [Terracidiphilus sp.]|nr:AAA family ATPase [Terracidiphilus sp.]